jgi:hypothetical protein
LASNSPRYFKIPLFCIDPVDMEFHSALTQHKQSETPRQLSQRGINRIFEYLGEFEAKIENTLDN